MKVFEKAIALIDYTIIMTDSKKAMKRKLKAFKIKYEKQELSKEDIERSYDSWKGHARHGNCFGLIREMDVLYKDIFKERENLYDTSN